MAALLVLFGAVSGVVIVRLCLHWSDVCIGEKRAIVVEGGDEGDIMKIMS